MSKRALSRSVATAIIVGVQAQAAGAADWLQFGFDPAHAGYNPAEHGYSTASGNRLVVGPIALPLGIDVAPAFVAGVVTPAGTKDLLFVVTKNGTATALDAATGAVVWSHLPSGTGKVTNSAVAVSPDRELVFAGALDGKVHAYRTGDGVEVKTGGWPQTVTLKPDVDKIASGLTIASAADGNSRLFAVTSSYSDKGDYQGSVTTIDLATGMQRVFNAQCSDLSIHFVENGTTSGLGQNDCPTVYSGVAGETANSGIWGRAGAVYDASTDRIYVATGNGRFDPNNDLGKGRDWGDSVLALNADGSGSGGGLPVDSYTPASDVELWQNDSDLGSTSPAILPAPAGSKLAHLAVQGGKDNCVRLLNLDDLNGADGPGHVGGELQAIAVTGAADHCADGGNANSFLTQPAVWVNPADASIWVFIAYAGGIAAYGIVVEESGMPSLDPQWSLANGGKSPVVANGTVYYAASGSVRALDATTGTILWSDDSIGNLHWQSPIVVNGRIYLIDSTSRLWVYELDGVFRAAFD